MSSFIKVKPEEMKYESFNYDKTQLEEEKQFAYAFSQPRMYSMNQLREVIYLHLNRSSLKSLVYMSSGDI